MYYTRVPAHIILVFVAHEKRERGDTEGGGGGEADAAHGVVMLRFVKMLLDAGEFSSYCLILAPVFSSTVRAGLAKISFSIGQAITFSARFFEF